ncbi:outer dynein arm-docking complex subunit 4 [Xenentodon cancila]
MSDTEENAEKLTLKVPFSTLLYEGDWLLSKGEYKKALECFTSALTLKPGDEKCLIGRAKCYMKIGQFQTALKEAETLLESDKSHYEGLYQKAEALYHMGNFPFALVFYHRGQKIRPQMEEFKLGVQRAQDAIQSVAGKFFNQETPLTHQERKHQHPHKKISAPFEPSQFMFKSLDDIDDELASGNAESSLKKAEEVLKVVQMWSEKEVPKKKEFLANVHHCIGNALFDLRNTDQALKHYQKDLELAKECKCPEEMSRALDKMGRTYVELEAFPLAIEFFKKMIPFVHDDLEKTCLFHNIGCCYVELKCHEEAREYGIRSAAAADQTADDKWQMYANVLVAVSELKLGSFESSVSHFEKALTHARVQDDDFSQNSLQKVLVWSLYSSICYVFVHSNFQNFSFRLLIMQSNSYSTENTFKGGEEWSRVCARDCLVIVLGGTRVVSSTHVATS